MLQPLFLTEPNQLCFVFNLQLWLQSNPHLWHQHNKFHPCPPYNHNCQRSRSALLETLRFNPLRIVFLVTSQVSLTHSSSLPSLLFTSSSALSVDVRVSEKLKSKIWTNEYVDFGSLLVNPLFENKYHVTFQNPQGGLTPS